MSIDFVNPASFLFLLLIVYSLTGYLVSMSIPFPSSPSEFSTALQSVIVLTLKEL